MLVNNHEIISTLDLLYDLYTKKPNKSDMLYLLALTGETLDPHRAEIRKERSVSYEELFTQEYNINKKQIAQKKQSYRNKDDETTQKSTSDTHDVLHIDIGN